MKTFLLISICFVISLTSLSAQIADSLKFINLTPAEFQERCARTKDALILDVREYRDYRKSHLKNSFNIPFTKGLETASDTIPKWKPLFIYCYAGGRSKKAAIFFYDKGFRKLYSMKSGMIGWKAASLPVTRRKPKSSGRRY
jgi:thioredoxin 1